MQYTIGEFVGPCDTCNFQEDCHANNNPGEDYPCLLPLWQARIIRLTALGASNNYKIRPMPYHTPISLEE
jgi:hypothetical protein